MFDLHNSTSTFHDKYFWPQGEKNLATGGFFWEISELVFDHLPPKTIEITVNPYGTVPYTDISMDINLPYPSRYHTQEHCDPSLVTAVSNTSRIISRLVLKVRNMKKVWCSPPNFASILWWWRWMICNTAPNGSFGVCNAKQCNWILYQQPHATLWSLL